MLEKSIRRTEAIDREALCIIAGEKVWQLRLTLHFLSDSGNLLDCASLASMAALRHFRKPDVEVIGDEITVVSTIRLLFQSSLNMDSTLQTNVHRYPSPCITFRFV